MNEDDKKKFLPSKAEVTEIGGHFLLATSQLLFYTALLLPLSFLWLIPAGDRFFQVGLRLFVVSLFLIFGFWMIPLKSAIYRRLFGNFVSEKLLKAYDYGTRDRFSAKGIVDEISRAWPLVVVGVLMLTIVSGVVDFNRPWSGPGSSHGKSSWVGPILEWFRAHSNTTKSLAWLLGVGSLTLFGYRIRCGWIHQTNVSKNDAIQ
jgi:hypothetical protein